MQGEAVEQYVGGYEGRADEINVGADRSADTLVADVIESAHRLHTTWDDVSNAAWSAPTRDVAGRELKLRDLPSWRWEELEVHLVDLAVGPTYRDWSEEFVRAWLPRLRPSLRVRLPDQTSAAAPGTLDSRDELAWLYGRLERTDLPVLAPWG
jgi:maleylpyruvate isomerase